MEVGAGSSTVESKRGDVMKLIGPILAVFALLDAPTAVLPRPAPANSPSRAIPRD
jgi:hypothetical protein